jgi:hypothetical protein
VVRARTFLLLPTAESDSRMLRIGCVGVLVALRLGPPPMAFRVRKTDEYTFP